MKVSSKSGLTLIEMLTVITIIGILAALLLPALHKARNRASRIKAYGEVTALKRAWGAYLLTYANDEGATLATPNDMSANNVAILSGQAGGNENPNRTQFMEFPEGAETTGFFDPWGHIYLVDRLELEPVTQTRSFTTRAFPAHGKRYD